MADFSQYSASFFLRAKGKSASCMNVDKPKRIMLHPFYRYAGARRDSELEQSIIRILVGIALVAYLVDQMRYKANSSLAMPLDFNLVIIGFLAIAVLLTFYVLWRPGEVPVRRLIAVILDVGALTYLFLEAEDCAAPLYFFYLWIIIGYGFRFGKKYLFLSLVLSLLGFGLVIAVVPFWAVQTNLSVGLWIGILVISLYLSTLVGRVFKALDLAEIANSAKRQFISSVSHELRTPLNAIIGMVDLLKSTHLDREQQDMLDCMSQTTQVMLSQIEDVLDFSKIEAGKMAVERTDFDLYRLVFGIVDIFRYHVDPLAVEFLTSIGGDVPPGLHGDSHHLRQILVNLLANAVKFTEQGRITIRIRKVDSDEKSIRLRFSVKDTGIGISYDAQSRIFESFTQADESTARRYGGTGLGTTICRQLVELMQGQIGFSSQPGVGSEFWFELSLALPVNETIAPPLHAMRCMVISASSVYLPLIADLLEQCGTPVQLEDDFDLALEKLEQQFLSGKSVRLIVLDIAVMPPCESIDQYRERLHDCVKKLRASVNDTPISLILLMPENLNEEVADELAEEAGFSAVLSTPVDLSALNHILYAHKLLLESGSKSKATAQVHPETTANEVIGLAQRADPASYHILVAEDNSTNRKVLQKILERAGHHCSLAKDGEEALNLIERKDFDVIILDMNMPLMSGTEVARTYRVMCGAQACAPMIMFSADVTPEAKQESLKAGANEFLSKPIQIELFLETLDRLVAQYRSMNFISHPTPISPKAKRLKLLYSDSHHLNLKTLNDLEKISRDPGFLEELIRDFVHENRKTLKRFETSVLAKNFEEIKEILHSLKGSALSIGAMSLMTTCKRIEKMTQNDIESRAQEILQVMKQVCYVLYEELEKYCRQRSYMTSEKSD